MTENIVLNWVFHKVLGRAYRQSRCVSLSVSSPKGYIYPNSVGKLTAQGTNDSLFRPYRIRTVSFTTFTGQRPRSLANRNSLLNLTMISGCCLRITSQLSRFVQVTLCTDCYIDIVCSYYLSPIPSIRRFSCFLLQIILLF